MTKIEAAELRSRRDMDRLKDNSKTENLKRPELAANRQKIKITTTTDTNYFFLLLLLLLIILIPPF